MAKSPDEIGKRYGILEVIGSLPHAKGAPRRHVLCRCDCGTIKPVARPDLRHGKIKSCGCLHHAPGNASPYFRGVGKVPATVFGDIRRKAQGRGIPFSITIEEAAALFEEQQGMCSLSGASISFSTGRHGNQTKGFCSLDRRDSARGYILINVTWVHAHVNGMKMDYPESYFLDWCAKVSAFKRIPGFFLMPEFAPNTHANFIGEGHLGGAFMKSCERHARDRKIPFDLTIKQAWDIFEKQGGRCALSGVDLNFRRYRRPGNASLDRINSGAYSPANVQFIHKHLNEMKWDMADDEFIGWCHKITDHQAAKAQSSSHSVPARSS
jgi:hypothetical protein